MMGDKPIWNLNSGDWIQDDERKRFNVLDRESRKVQANQLGLDIISGAKWHSTTESDCGGFFPPEFDCCSFCGKPLLAAGEHQNDFWVPPFGGGRGLRLVSERIHVASIPTKQENTIRWVDQDKDIFPLPRPRGDYEFVVAPLGTKSPVLVAFDRTTGLLDYFSPAGLNGGKWISLTPSPGRRVGENKLPNWSWSAAVVSGKAGFAVPTSEGPVWIGLDWQNGKCIPELDQGECIGGAATLENQIFMPALVEKAIAVQSFDFSANRWKQVTGTPVQDFVLKSGEDRYFSVPIVDAGRRIIYWTGVTGLLTFDLTSYSCSWRPWETDAHPCRAVLEFGPPYQDPEGNFWQICYDDYDQSQEERAFRYYKLSGDETDREDVDGGRFSSGISCFSKPYDLWEKPWAKIDKRQEQAKTIRAPLLCLDEESKATITANFGKGSISLLLEVLKDRSKKYLTELRIESPELAIELRMLHAFNIHTPWELRLFIYQDYLYAYSIDEALCYKWRLK